MHMKNVIPTMLACVVSATAQQGPPSAKVVVAPIVTADIAETIDLVGLVETRQRSTVAAQTDGAVAKVLHDAGDRVSAGDVLVQLDRRPLEIARDAALARQAEDAARHREQQAARDRAKALFDKGRIAESAYDAERHAEEALRQRVAADAAEVRRIEDLLEKSAVKAPFAGAVVQRHVEVGEWVDQGGPIVEIVALDPVDVVLELPERHAGRADLAAPVVIEIDGVPGRRFEGKVRALVPDADIRAHTLPLKVTVENKDGALHPGMFARARVALQEQRSVLLAPKDALSARGPMSQLIRVADGVAEAVMVQRGVDHKDKAVITGDIAAGDLVVVRGNERVFPGQPLEITETLE